MRQVPTVDDVARTANVSRQTVSNVLNAPQVVRAETRARVERAIAELGYRPHGSARRLRSRKSFTIGMALDPLKNGISGNVLDRFLHAVTEKADERGMRILLFTARERHSQLDQMAALRDGSDVDAFVLTGTEHGDPRIDWLTDNNVPFVTFGRPWGDDDFADRTHLWVDVDGYAGVHDATARLIEQGARRVGFLGWPSPSGTGDERRRGWREASERMLQLTDADLAALSASVEDGVEQGAAAASRLLEAAQPDAFVCASDSLALGAAMAATRHGRRMPVVGYDNTPVAAAVGLSSVDQPLEEVASAALELLFGPSGTDVVPRTGNEEPKNRLLAPRLVERDPSGVSFGEITGTANAGNHTSKGTS